MDKQQTIYVLSDNRDFIEPFCALVTRELAIPCMALSSENDVPGHSSALVISDRGLSNKNIAVININLPININRLLNEIEIKFAQKADNSDSVEISPDLRLSLQNKLVTHKVTRQEVILTDKESQLLQVIAQAGDSGISRESLLKEVWGIGSALDTHTLETHIYRLRKKLRDSFDLEIIKASEGGYKL